MTRGEIAWSEMFKDLFQSSRFRTWGFISGVTYALLINAGIGPVFSLLILAPCSYISYLLFFFILEQILFPFYKWLTKGSK
jgi:hypothetical protein